jgi:hypothetical protein
MGSEIQVAVADNPEDKITCPEHHVMAVAVDSGSEAHYLCGMLMSSPVELIVGGYTTTTGISTHVLQHVNIPTFQRSDGIHNRIAEISKECHKVARDRDPDQAVLGKHREEIDRLAAKLWGITKEELRAVEEALEGRELPTRQPAGAEDDE